MKNSEDWPTDEAQASLVVESSATFQASYASSIEDEPDDRPPDHDDDDDVSFLAEPAAQVRCRDPFWSVLFLLNTTVIIYLAVSNGGGIVKGDFGNKDAAWGRGYAMLGCLGATVGFAGALCGLWFWAVLRDPKGMVLRSFTLWAAVYAVSSLCFLVLGQLWFGFGCLLGCFLILCLYASAVTRMDFAASNLSLASQAIRAHPGCACVTLLSMLLSVAWSAAFLAAVVGTTEAIRDEDGGEGASEKDSLSASAIFLFLVSFYWGGLVISNVSHVAVSGTVASWWFRPDSRQDSGAVAASLLRALTWSLGSVCVGSLLVAVLEATRSMLSMVRGQCGRCMTCCVDCVLFYVDAWVRYINRFTFVYVAMYGDNFSEAGEKVNDLFSRRGFWTTIINDWILSRVFAMGTLGIGLASAGFAYALSTLAFGIKGNNADVMGVFGLFVGWLPAAVVMGTLDSAVATVYVAFGEEPNALKRNHPEAFNELYRGWHENYPTATAYILLV